MLMNSDEQMLLPMPHYFKQSEHIMLHTYNDNE